MNAAFCLPLLFLLLASPAVADAYKCRQPDGRTVISAAPCAEGGQAVKTIPDDPVPDAERERAEREAERLRAAAEKNRDARREMEKQEQQAHERAETRPAPPPPAVEPVYVPAPYYVGTGRLRPPPPPPPPQQRPPPPPPPPAVAMPAKPAKPPDGHGRR